jgi:hypothetical protein
MTLSFCGLFIGNFASAEVNSITVKAIYKSKKGKSAQVLYRGKLITVSTEQIQNFSKAITGTEVKVALYPENIGLTKGK